MTTLEDTRPYKAKQPKEYDRAIILSSLYMARLALIGILEYWNPPDVRPFGFGRN